ncbi:MmgE/PrpD family protein [Phenylobacterium terrae]|uniref:MmgE/PrpD family protein n=1 Tax=Phenylobacterium terrae TaxID=2665495 RepID=A0ABW4N2R3_9CAUL
MTTDSEGTLTARPATGARPSPAAPTPAVTGPLSRFIAGAQSMKIDEETLDLGRRHILDTLAATVACRDLEPSVLARRFALAHSGDARRSAATILATHEKAAIVDAVFASAMTAHGAEINDFNPSALVQPGPAIVSAAIALAEQRRLPGAAVLKAVIVGYEIAGRLPKALGRANLNRSGLANHGIAPTFGVAACAASLTGLAEDRISDVLTYCSQQASGSWQWLLDVEHVEKSFVFAGMGARAGLQAALFVEHGFRGVRDNLDHPGGFMNQGMFTAPGGDLNRAYLVEELGSRWELPLTAYKKYPTGGPTQPAVEGLLQLLPELDRERIESVRIEMPGRWQAFRDAAMPALNLRYLTAIILIDRRLDFVSAQSLERMHGDAQVGALMGRVDVVHDPKQEAGPGQERVESARVIVTEAGGRRREAFVPYVTGFPSHPMSRAEVEEKARGLLTPALGKARTDALVERVWTLEAMPNAGELAGMIAT